MKNLCFALLVLLAFTHRSYGQYPKYLYGVASWYGEELAGEVTASGEIFDPDEYTAAHQTLPFGTIIEVENLGNGNTVEVVINDRGPYVENRIIDLSKAAAEELGFVDEGKAYVKVTVIEFGEDEVEEDSVSEVVAETRSTSTSMKEEVVDETKLPVSQTNTVTNTVTVTNKVTSRFTNVITNAAFTYRDYSVEREAGNDLFELDTEENYDDLFIIEEPEVEPSLPVEEYEWTPDTMDFYTMKSTSNTNKSKNVVDLGVPENVDIEPEPLKTNTVETPAASATESSSEDSKTESSSLNGTGTADDEALFQPLPVLTTTGVGASDSEFDFSFILDNTPITPDELMTNEYAIEIEEMYIETEASTEAKTSSTTTPAVTNEPESSVVYIYQTNYINPEPMNVYVTNYVSVEVPKTNTQTQPPVAVNVRNTNKIIIEEPEKVTVFVTNYIEIPAKTNITTIPSKVTITNVVKETNVVKLVSTPDNTKKNTPPATTKQVDDGISYAIQVGAFKKEANALSLYEKLRDYGYDVFTTETYVNSTRYIRVRVGYYDTLLEAGNIAEELEDYDLPVLIVKVELVEE